MVGVWNDMRSGTIRQQAGSYKEKHVLVFVGAGLPAMVGVWNDMRSGTIRQQAGSYKEKHVLVFVGCWSAGDGGRVE